MAQYRAQQQGGNITQLETAPLGEHQLLMLTFAVGRNEAVDAILAALQATRVSSTEKNGAISVLATTTLSDQALLQALAEKGESLAPLPPEKKPFNPWAWRGITSIAGQSLQIAASFFSKSSAADRAALFGFASLNLMANFINITFGAQEKKDRYQLRYLKNTINQQLTPLLNAQGALPDANISQLDQRPKPQKTSQEKFKDFLNKYSVTFGEIGLRTVGSISLAFPITKWGKAARAFSSGGFKAAYRAGKNDTNSTFIYGVMMLAGKFTSFAASEPDPYNPEPPSLVRQFREKVAFRLSSVIEGTAATYNAYSRLTLKDSRTGIAKPDYYGGAGSTIFSGGYLIRLGAPYGTREVDMPELYAHISNALSKLPPEKIPQAVGDISLQLAEHFHAKKLNATAIGAAILADLEKNHHITPATPPSQPITASPRLTIREAVVETQPLKPREQAIAPIA